MLKKSSNLHAYPPTFHCGLWIFYAHIMMKSRNVNGVLHEFIDFDRESTFRSLFMWHIRLLTPFAVWEKSERKGLSCDKWNKIPSQKINEKRMLSIDRSGRRRHSKLTSQSLEFLMYIQFLSCILNCHTVTGYIPFPLN